MKVMRSNIQTELIVGGSGQGQGPRALDLDIFHIFFSSV